LNRTPAAVVRDANAVLLTDANIDAESIAQFFTPDYVAHLTDKDMTGHDSVRRYLGMLHRAFSDVDVDVDVLLERDDRVSWQRTIRATHTGAYAGFPATDRPIVWRDIATSRLDQDGLIAEEWIVSELAERLLLARKK